MDSNALPNVGDVRLGALVHTAFSAFQLGSLFTWGLHGVLCVQVYNYYLSFPNDPITRKIVVYLVLALETVQLVLVTRDVYQIFVIGFGNFAILKNLQLIPLTIPILGGIIGIICHLMFAYRIALVSQSKVIGGLIAILALCSSASSFVFGGKLFAAKNLANAVTNPSTMYLACGLWNGFGAGCDVLIAACMTFYLSRTPTGFKKTDLFITRIIRLTIETGVVTATASIASVTLFVGFRGSKTSVYFILPAVMIAKLYSITILATFNNRPHAVGGPPTLPDTENSYDTGMKHGKAHTHLDSNREIRIGRTVVEQVWSDDIPMSNVGVFKTNPQGLIPSAKDDTDVSQTDLTKSITRSLGNSTIYD